MLNDVNAARNVACFAAVTFFVLASIASECVAQRRNATSSVAQALAGSADIGFAKADAPREFIFPDDHGPHREFKHEWWYFTGNLSTADGRRFGYQLTFFRIGLVPHIPDRKSSWATSEIYMAHFALSDVATEQFHHRERISRPVLGLAGSAVSPLRVWLNDWSISQITQSATPRCFGCISVRLKAKDEDTTIDLVLQSNKPAVFHGDRGLSRKNAEQGNASYYYSLTRMRTQGKIKTAGETHDVEGLSWLDREWSTSALGDDQTGWDWFSLQLSNNTEIMFYQLRRVDGSVDPFSSGTLIHQDGVTTSLSANDVQVEVIDYWRSPDTGVRYPNRWRLVSEGQRLQLVIDPLISGQELNVAVRYWEGAVSVRGKWADGDITGSGYVELTGYD